MRRPLDRDLGQPLVAADAVIGVDDEVARGERGELGEEGVGALAALAAADEAVAEHVLLGEQGDVAAGEAVIELDDGERDGADAPSASCQVSASTTFSSPCSASRPLSRSREPFE